MAEQTVTVLVCDMYHKADRKHAAKASHTMYVAAGAGRAVRRVDLCTSHFEQLAKAGTYVTEVGFVKTHPKGRAEPEKEEPKRKPGGQLGQPHAPSKTDLTCEVCGMSGLNTFAMGQHMRHHRERGDTDDQRAAEA